MIEVAVLPGLTGDLPLLSSQGLQGLPPCSITPVPKLKSSNPQNQNSSLPQSDDELA